MLGGLGQHGGVNGRERLKVLYTNVRSMNGKMEDLEAGMDGEGYDEVVVNDRWCREQSNWRIGIQGDRVYRCDRKEKKGAVWKSG